MYFVDNSSFYIHVSMSVCVCVFMNIAVIELATMLIGQTNTQIN